LRDARRDALAAWLNARTQHAHSPATPLTNSVQGPPP
jgi:hypothetical protein